MHLGDCWEEAWDEFLVECVSGCVKFGVGLCMSASDAHRKSFRHDCFTLPHDKNLLNIVRLARSGEVFS